jgi:predicted transcriptional regulator
MIAQSRTSDIKATGGNESRCGFTQKQDAAINLLATGYSVADAAAVLGVSRSALLKWKSNKPSFRDEINRRRREIEATGALARSAKV